MGKGGQIWLKCITVDLNMMLRDKNNIFETTENFHAEMAWNYPYVLVMVLHEVKFVSGCVESGRDHNFMLH